MKILYVTSEASPFAASGGLGDVMGALPPVIASSREDITCEVILPLYKGIRAEYREKMEIAESDERNSFIRLKAWAWTGSLQILILATAVIVLKIMGLDLWSLAASYGVCLILILYYVTWFVLRKKY